MADNILRLKVESQEYDAKLKRAAQGLQQYVDGCRKVGRTLEVVEKETLDYVKAVGKMETTSRSAKGQLGEMTKTFTDLSMEYKHLTDQEKAAPFGKALSASLDQLQGRIQQTKADLNDINSKLSGAMPEAGGGGLFGGGKFDGMLQVFGGNLMTKGAGMALGLAAEMKDMVAQGIELAKQGEGIRIAFERLGRGDILQGLREATHGTVTDLELMKAAVKFNDFKLPLDELGTMLAFAQQKAKDTGQSVDYMVDSIVTGLGRKSLMILDNLGLSAAQIKERMAETGDMTKAVGAIIREEMAKAGDYVETAADRALQANVSLQNKMEELGRKFAPVEEASNQLWTSIKIGILDIVSGPLAKLLNGLTEAGRLRNELNNVNGEGENNKVDNELKKLKAAKTAGASDYILKSMQSGVIEGFNREIINLDTEIKKLQRKAGEDMDGNMAAGIESRIKDLTTRQNAYRTMIANYQSGASGITNNIPSPTSTPTVPPTPTVTPTTTTPKASVPKELTEMQNNQQRINELTQEYVNISDQSTQEVIDRQAAIREEIRLLEERNSRLKLYQEQAHGRFLGGDVQTEGLAGKYMTSPTSGAFRGFAAVDMNPKNFVIKREDKDKKNTNKEEKKDPTAAETLQGIQTMVGSLQTISSGIETLGIELPKELNDIFGVLQTITGIIGAIQAMQQIGTFLGLFSHGGKVPHAATGYYVPGTKYSGDTTPILANAGELVLNQSSQSNLAADLKAAESLVKMLDSYQASLLFRSQMGSDVSFSGGVMQNLQLSASITGEQIRLVLNNNGRRTGHGEYVTTNFR